MTNIGYRQDISRDNPVIASHASSHFVWFLILLIILGTCAWFSLAYFRYLNAESIEDYTSWNVNSEEDYRMKIETPSNWFI